MPFLLKYRLLSHFWSVWEESTERSQTATPICETWIMTWFLFSMTFERWKTDAVLWHNSWVDVSAYVFLPGASQDYTRQKTRGGVQVTSSPADNKLWYWFILPDDSPTNLSSKCVQNHTEILKNNKTDCHFFVFFDCFLVKTSSRGNKQAKCCNVLNSSALRTARVIITTLDYWFIKHFPKVLHKGSNSKTFKSYNHLVLKKNLVTTGNRYKKTN